MFCRDNWLTSILQVYYESIKKRTFWATSENHMPEKLNENIFMVKIINKDLRKKSLIDYRNVKEFFLDACARVAKPISVK